MYLDSVVCRCPKHGLLFSNQLYRVYARGTMYITLDIVCAQCGDVVGRIFFVFNEVSTFNLKGGL